MAKKNFGNIADEFLTNVQKQDDVTVSEQSKPYTEKGIASKARPMGRPKADDIRDKKIKKLGVYVTEEQFKRLNIYSAENEIDKSEAVRRIFGNFFKMENEKS